ncbi:hypothetical protein GW17_00059647 [Ensete ventricosum]|nr:hypothetical protein GW17_00059647 [Ensete ventricosum]RZS06635.1 hypothetical protein BHM03_00037320 [Ensete ventricosum]
MRPLACEAAVAGVRGRHLRGRYCTWWPLDTTPAARDCLLMWLWSAACGGPVCDRRLMLLPPTRDRPSARPGSSVAWPMLLICAHTLLNAVLPQADPAKTQ